MVEKRFGRELMVGVARDPVFGQVISFGAGGVAVELLRDNAIGLPPLNRRLATDLIDRTRVARLLSAYRHIPAANQAAIVDVLVRVSEMVCALPWLQEMDINPLSADDAGAVALDARVVIDPTRLAGDSRYSHMAVHPYPARLDRRETLRDGTVLVVRPIRPEDAGIELAFVEALSEQSRYTRFFNPTRTLSPRMLARFTQVDYERELALIAIPSGDPAAAMAGVARYSPNADGTSCEFAVTVADAWHRRGVAGILMRRLIDAAREAGYQRISGSVLSSNGNMRALMRSLGFTMHADPTDTTVVEYALDLT
jgi:acetyltransferase